MIGHRIISKQGKNQGKPCHQLWGKKVGGGVKRGESSLGGDRGGGRETFPINASEEGGWVLRGESPTLLKGAMPITGKKPMRGKDRA